MVNSKEISKCPVHSSHDVHFLPWERAGRYMEFHGYRNFRGGYSRPFDEALEKAPPHEIVNGEEGGG